MIANIVLIFEERSSRRLIPKYRLEPLNLALRVWFRNLQSAFIGWVLDCNRMELKAMLFNCCWYWDILCMKFNGSHLYPPWQINHRPAHSPQPTSQIGILDPSRRRYSLLILGQFLTWSLRLKETHLLNRYQNHSSSPLLGHLIYKLRKAAHFPFWWTLIRRVLIKAMVTT